MLKGCNPPFAIVTDSKFPLTQKQNELPPPHKQKRTAHFSLAGPAGFEPSSAGVKVLCLTAWRWPTSRLFPGIPNHNTIESTAWQDPFRSGFSQKFSQQI